MMYRIYIIGFLFFLNLSLMAEDLGIKEEIKSEDLMYEDVDDEIYARIFGRKRADKNVMLEFNVFLDGEKLGEVAVLLGKSNMVFAESLKEILADYISSEFLQKIDTIRNSEGFVPIEKMKLIGMETKLNKLLLQLEIVVPIKMKKIRALNRRFRGENMKTNVRQADISGFMNVRFSDTLYKHNGSYNNHSLILTHALNIHGLVLEGEVSHTYSSSNTKEKSKFHRDWTTLVYNWIDKDVFFYVGDISNGSLSYQSIPRMLGVRIKREPESNYETSNNEQIQVTILKKSTIKVYLNDTLVREKENVAPGTYILDDIYFVNGNNDVKIKIIDDSSREQTLGKDFFLEKSFLAPGDFAFDFAIGYPRIVFKENEKYDHSNRIISAFVKYGLLSATEIGVGFQNNRQGNIYTTELKHKNIAGSVDMKFAQSKYKNRVDKNDEKSSGKIFYMSYSPPSVTIFDNVNINCGVSYEKADTFFFPSVEYERDVQSDDFLRQPNDNFIIQRENIKGKNVNTRYFLSVSNIFSMNFYCHYSTRTYASRRGKDKTFSLHAYKDISINSENISRINANLVFEATKTYDNFSDKRLGLYFTVYLGNNYRVSSGYFKNQSDKSVYVSFAKDVYNKGCGYEVSLARGGNVTRYDVNANYSHPAFKIDAVHSGQNKGNDSSTRVGIETCLFFADGNFAVARNSIFDGGFVIAVPKGAIKDNVLKFQSENIESNIFGGAVIPTRKNSLTNSRIDLTEIPDNVDIPQDSVVVYGEYKRGAVVDIVGEGDYLAKGYLCDKAGECIKHAIGYVVCLTNTKMKPLQFFTNASGKFVIAGLRCGKYKVSINIEGFKDFYINIKESDPKMLNLGNVVCEETVDDI